MWPRTHILVFFVYVTALFLHSEGVPTTAGPALESICKVTRFPEVCVATIEPLVKGRKVDALSALEAEIKTATDGFKLAKQLVEQQAHDKATPRPVVDGLKVCNENFDMALNDLEAAKRTIVNNNNSLKRKVMSISTYVETCIDSLKEVPDVDSPVAPLATDLSMISSNCLALALQYLRSKPIKTSKPAFTQINKGLTRPNPTSVNKGTTRSNPTSAVRGLSKARPTSTSVDASLSSICKQTMYADICVSTIAPLLKGGKVDAVSALKAEVQTATVSFQQAKAQVEKAIAGGDRILSVCNENFESALGDLHDVQKAMAGGNNSVGLKLERIVTFVETCTDSLNERGVKSPISTVALGLTKLSSNCLHIMKQIRL